MQAIQPRVVATNRTPAPEDPFSPETPHNRVLLNHLLPPMAASHLQVTPENNANEETKKFASLNTRNSHKISPRFHSMRILKKRNIGRFYPNTEYMNAFTEINNNKEAVLKENDDEHESEPIIYANCPNMLRVKSDISGIEEFQNLTDSIQVCEEFDADMSKDPSPPVPAPRTKISPYCSPVKSDHVYINLSMPLINTKNLSHELRKGPEDKPDLIKPNVVAATPKRIAPVTSPALVRSALDMLKDNNTAVVIPKKQVIIPSKTLQIPQLHEKPVPRSLRRTRSEQVRGGAQVCFLFVLILF